MAKTYDFSAFDKPAPSRSPSEKKYDFSAFEPKAASEEPGEVEAALRGAVQGGTFGFGDEIAGGGEALLDAISGKDGSLSDNYAKHRDESRLAFKAAEAAHPLVSAAGNLAGGVATGLLTGGAGAVASEANWAQKLVNAGLIGAGSGALSGAGNSEKSDLSGIAGDAYQGGKTGALVGGALQGGLSAIGGIADGLGGLKTVQNVGKALKRGVAGEDLVSTAGLDAVENKARGVAQELGLTARDVNQETGSALGAARKAASGNKLDITSDVETIEKAIANLKDSINPGSEKDVAFLEKLLDKAKNGKEKTVTFKGKSFKPGETVPAIPSAEDNLRLELAKENANRLATGQKPLDGNFSRSQDENGNRLLTLLKTGEEQTGAVERAVPITEERAVLNKAGEATGKTRNVQSLGEDGKPTYAMAEDPDLAANTKSTAVAKTVEDVAGTPETFKPGAVDDVEKNFQTREGSNDLSNLDYSKAQDINSTLKDIAGVSDTPTLQTNEATNAVKVAGKGIKDKLNSVGGVKEANDANAASFRAMEELGIDENSFIKGADGKVRLTGNGEARMKGIVRRMDRDTDAGANAADKLQLALNELKAADPAKAAAIESKVKDASEALNLAQQAQGLGLLNKSTYLKSGSVAGANKLGLGISSVGKDIASATPDVIKNIAMSMVNSGKPAAMKLGQLLGDTLKKDQVGRNAAIFALQQNPSYRQMIQEHSKDESQK